MDVRLLRPFREQPRHPSRRERGRKCQAQRRARAFGFEHALINQSRYDAARLAITRADDSGCIAARQLSAIEHGFENITRFGRKLSESNLFLAPHQDAGAQAIRLNETFHEFNLVNAQFQEEARESGESFFAQIAASIEIVSAGLIAIGEMTFVLYDVAAEATCD